MRDQLLNCDSDWLVCHCGNTPDSDGFFTSEKNGATVSPDINGVWDGRTYTCHRCWRIIDLDTTTVIGVCSEKIAHDNTNYDWTTY